MDWCGVFVHIVQIQKFSQYTFHYHALVQNTNYEGGKSSGFIVQYFFLFPLFVCVFWLWFLSFLNLLFFSFSFMCLLL